MRLRARPVVGLDRGRKARMINAFLEDAFGHPPEGLRILDLGCGNGDICAHFADRNFIIGVDIRDQARLEHGTLLRCLAQSEALPFEDASFDAVISHHVIEHVSDHHRHLAEIRRVMMPEGVCYLGTPNRSSPFMRGHVGNQMVLRYAEMRPLFMRHGFTVEECYLRFLHQPDRYHCEIRLGRLVPQIFLQTMRRWFPSQCFLLRKRGQISS